MPDLLLSQRHFVDPFEELIGLTFKELLLDGRAVLRRRVQKQKYRVPKVTSRIRIKTVAIRSTRKHASTHLITPMYMEGRGDLHIKPCIVCGTVAPEAP